MKIRVQKFRCLLPVDALPTYHGNNDVLSVPYLEYGKFHESSLLFPHQNRPKQSRHLSDDFSSNKRNPEQDGRDSKRKVPVLAYNKLRLWRAKAKVFLLGFRK